MNNITDKNICFRILDVLLYNVEYYIYDIINNKESKSQYSAVYINNLILSCIQIAYDLGEPLPYQNVEGYFAEELFASEEYSIFEEKRKQESINYIGKQYTEDDLELS